MMALRAGAYHVTCAERWLYLALEAREALLANGFAEERFTVLYKRATDLRLLVDLPMCCNLLLCDVLDDGMDLCACLHGKSSYSKEQSSMQAFSLSC